MWNIWKIIAAGVTFISAGFEFVGDKELLTEEQRANPRFFEDQGMQIEIADQDVPRSKIVYVNGKAGGTPVIVRDPNIAHVINDIDYPRFQQFFTDGETNENVSGLARLMGWRETKGRTAEGIEAAYKSVYDENGTMIGMLVAGTKLFISPKFQGDVICEGKVIATIGAGA